MTAMMLGKGCDFRVSTDGGSTYASVGSATKFDTGNHKWNKVDKS